MQTAISRLPISIHPLMARKKFANIINRVAYGKESFVLTRRGEALAAIVSMEDLKLLQEIEDAWIARNEPGESTS